MTKKNMTKTENKRGRGMDTVTPLAGGSRERLNSESWASESESPTGKVQQLWLRENIALSATYASSEFRLTLQTLQGETAPRETFTAIAAWEPRVLLRGCG
jgi:hypothetical protein